MDLDFTPTPSTSPDNSENETPPRTQIQSIVPLSTANGAAKKLHHRPAPPPPLVVTYKECMKNHAATLGGHAVDGCGEFMLSPSSTSTDPTSLTCAACGCHRNFHRRDPAEASPTNVSIPLFLDFQHPPPPRRASLSPSPPAQPYFAPHTLMTLSSAVAAEEQTQQAAPVTPIAGNPLRRKRFRTKFSHDQKEKMQCFSEKLGWKMQGCDRAAVEEFCREIGVPKGVLKVWMHNNKSTSGRKKMDSSGVDNINGEMISLENKSNRENEDNNKIGSHSQHEINGGGVRFHVSNNSSSPSH